MLLQEGWVLGAEYSFAGCPTELPQSTWSLQPLRLPRRPLQVLMMLGWAQQRLILWLGSLPRRLQRWRGVLCAWPISCSLW